MFTIPNLPTDNYYKFKALAFFTACCICVFLLVFIKISTTEKAQVLRREIALKKAEMKIIELEIVENRESASGKVKALQKMDLSFYIIKPIIDSINEELEKNRRETKQLRYKVAAFDAIVKAENENLDLIESTNNFYRVSLIVFFWICLIFSILSFREWYLKSQKPNDLKLELEIKKLQKELNIGD